MASYRSLTVKPLAGVVKIVSSPAMLPSTPSNQASQTQLLRLSAPLGAAAMTVLLVFLAIQADTVQTPGGAKHQIDGKQLAAQIGDDAKGAAVVAAL